MSTASSISDPIVEAIRAAIIKGLPPTNSSTSSAPRPRRAIIFHGNCCDGIAAAHLLAEQSSGDSLYFPVSPSESRTWPDPKTLIGYEIVFADVCFPREDMLAYGKIASDNWKTLTVYDHHPLAALIAAAESPFNPASVISTAHCATHLIWSAQHPSTAPPKWVQMVDDTDNWRNITPEHRALREVIHPIAKMAVERNPQVALLEFANLVNNRLATEEGWTSVIAEGQALLDAKIANQERMLAKCPTLKVGIRESPWPLPHSWAGDVYVVNSSREFIGSSQFDTTLQAEILFERHPELNVFVNYHIVQWIKAGVQHRKFVYHARARDGTCNLTQCPVLKGHPSAAGGQEEERSGIPTYFEL